MTGDHPGTCWQWAHAALGMGTGMATATAGARATARTPQHLQGWAHACYAQPAASAPGRGVPPGTVEGKGDELLRPMENNQGRSTVGSGCLGSEPGEKSCRFPRRGEEG